MMRILMSASRGLIGRAVSTSLAADGHDVVRLARRRAGPGEVLWDPAAGRLDPAALEGVDAVIHLSGEPILGRWTRTKKIAIRASRVDSTRLLSRALAGLRRPPAVFLVASAVGVYGDRGTESLTEDSSLGTDWLARVTAEWEAAAAPAAERGIRVAHLRSGLVLSRDGGALKQMLLPFRLGAGGPVGSGRAYWSWIAIDDWVGAARHLLTAGELRGPVNLTAPHAVTNGEFARTLGRVLRRPALLPVPPFALRLLFGEAAATVLTGSRVLPSKLLASGYQFAFPHLEPALRHLLGRGKESVA
jgi:uncharacterized protein